MFIKYSSWIFYFPLIPFIFNYIVAIILLISPKVGLIKPSSNSHWTATIVSVVAPPSDLVELLLGDVGFVLGAQRSEGALNLLAGLDVLRFPADHEGHVLLQRHVAVPARDNRHGQYPTASSFRGLHWTDGEQ